MKTKRAHCSSCSPDSNHAIWEGKKVFDLESCEWLPVWECRCCHATMPRRVVRKTSATAALLASREPISLDAVLEAMRSDRR